jgi:hypothetical protein
MIGRALMSGIISSGSSVIDLSVLPAPVSRYWSRRNRVSAVHVQTSPVDPRSADVRIFDDHGLDIDKRSERKLEGLFFGEDIRRVPLRDGRITPDQQTDRYMEDMLAKLDLEIHCGRRSGGDRLQQRRVRDGAAGSPARIELRGHPLNARSAILDRAGTTPFQAHLQEMGVFTKIGEGASWIVSSTRQASGASSSMGGHDFALHTTTRSRSWRSLR